MITKPEHGTVERYDAGCSCGRCREAGVIYPPPRVPPTAQPLSGAPAREHARRHGIPEVRVNRPIVMAIARGRP